MKKIPLTKGKFATVDDRDFFYLSKVKWCSDRGYAVRRESGQAHRLIYMHREIMNFPKKEGVDHIDGNGLNNQRSNLRICSQQKNLWNRSGNKRKIYSKFKGVSFHKPTGYWTATLKTSGKAKRVYTKSETEAVKKYNEMALKTFGEYAYLNKLE